MEILRIAENVTGNVILVDFDVPGDYTDSDFVLKVTDLSDLSVSESPGTYSSGETITVGFNKRYDAEYLVELYSEEDSINVYEETHSVIRPYVNPNTLGETASEIANATANEELARAIIDAVIPQGFYYKKTTIETTGLGADYLPLWVDAKKILSVYENNTLVTDRTFEITKDKSAITQYYSGKLNRKESANLIMPASNSDYLEISSRVYGAFPQTYDYKFVIEEGYTSVPSDIVRATEILINDIACGKLDYYKRYVSDYRTDQYSLKFDSRVFEGTGNVIVDKILSKYRKSITRLGVL